MRVLTICNYFPPADVGGAEISAHNTVYGLRQRGLDASVMVINAHTPLREDRHDSIHGIPTHRVLLPRTRGLGALWQTFDPRVYRQVIAELERVRPDLVHIHNLSGASLAPIAACARRGVPVVLTLHDHWLLCPNNMLYQGGGRLCDPAEGSVACSRCFRLYDFWANIPYRRQVFSRLVQSVRLFVSPSEKLVDLHVAAGYDRARFRVVRYGIIPRFSEIAADSPVRQAVRGSGWYRNLLFSGAIVESKGIPTIIEALPLLVSRLDRIRLIVAGAGDEPLMARLRGFGSERVLLLGRVPFPEMGALYATSDLSLVPSTWYDNSPMVIYESLLAGTPVVGSAIGGIPELIEDGETGYLSPPGEAAELVERIVAHLRRPAQQRRSMRRQCVEYARAHYTLDAHLERLLPVYREALEG